MAEISVIIPVYNAGQYIEKCLDALCRQTFSDIEILCIDDGSSDDTWQHIAKHAAEDKRIRAWRQQNAGPAATRNRGLQNASAPYIMFCDADDWYEPDFCRRMLEIMKTEDTDTAVACCHVVVEDCDCAEREISESHYNSSLSGRFAMTDRLCQRTSVVLWNKIFKKELIDRYGICFPEGCEHDDDVFWTLYGMVSKSVYFEKQKLYNYRIRPNSIMSNYFNRKPKDKYDRLKVSRFVVEFWRRGQLPAEKRAAVSDFCRTQISIMFFDLFSPEELEQIVAEANRMELDYCFAIRKGKIFMAQREGLEEAGRIKLLKYILLSKLTFGSKRKIYKQEKKTVRNQLRMKKLLGRAV